MIHSFLLQTETINYKYKTNYKRPCKTYLDNYLPLCRYTRAII